MRNGLRSVMTACALLALSAGGCASATAVKPSATVPSPSPTPVAPTRPAAAPPPAEAAPPQDADDGSTADAPTRLGLYVPTKGEWHIIAGAGLPGAWKVGLASDPHKALVLVDFSEHGNVAAKIVEDNCGLMLSAGMSCGAKGALADGRGSVAPVTMDGGTTLGRFAAIELGKKPGDFTLFLFGQWPKAEDGEMSRQFDLIVTRSVLGE